MTILFKFIFLLNRNIVLQILIVINWYHIFNAEKCPKGYSNKGGKDKSGSVDEVFMINKQIVKDIDECTTLCDEHQFCESLEYNRKNKYCKLNNAKDVSSTSEENSQFCAKSNFNPHVSRVYVISLLTFYIRVNNI